MNRREFLKDAGVIWLGSLLDFPIDFNANDDKMNCTLYVINPHDSSKNRTRKVESLQISMSPNMKDGRYSEKRVSVKTICDRIVNLEEDESVRIVAGIGNKKAHLSMYRPQYFPSDHGRLETFFVHHLEDLNENFSVGLG